MTPHLSWHGATAWCRRWRQNARDALLIDPPVGDMQLLASCDRGRTTDVSPAPRGGRRDGETVVGHYTGEIAEQGLFLGFAAWTDARSTLAQP